MHICPGCNLEMKDGQACNGLLKCHWDCQDIVKKQDGAYDRAVNAAIVRLAYDGITPSHPLYSRMLKELKESLQ